MAGKLKEKLSSFFEEIEHKNINYENKVRKILNLNTKFAFNNRIDLISKYVHLLNEKNFKK